jgi:hypothetical protein
MILPETPRPTLWPPKTLSSDEDGERLDRALEDLIKLDRALEDLIKENQWVDDFIERLNYTIEDIVRKK